jgi:hypothetical protein
MKPLHTASRLLSLCLVQVLLWLPSLASAGDLPDLQKTPGDTFPVTKEQVCQRDYSPCVRHVPKSMEDKVFKSYGVRTHKPKEYEIDHLISIELGEATTKRTYGLRVTLLNR